MAGKVFISCGQANRNERQVADQLASWFVSQGFHPYVAIQTQSILEVNTGIIGELKSSDFYLFVNFRRDNIRHHIFLPSKQDFYRGSIFTNQELAIAYAMAFDQMIFVNQKCVKREGIFGYLVSNTPEFDHNDDVLPIVQAAVASARWDPAYSRNLDFGNLRWSDPIYYTDHTGTRLVKALHIDIVNNRPDKGASNCIARLDNILHSGTPVVCPDRSNLKCTGSPGYSNTIWPNNHIAFDLFSIDLEHQSNIFLHSAIDTRPRLPIISTIDLYQLHYQVFAENYPLIEFKIELNVTGNEATTTAKLV